MPQRYLTTAAVLLVLGLPLLQGLHAQDVDGRLATPPSSSIKQHWPGVFVRGNKLYVRWGEARPSTDPNIRVDEIWYTLGEWARRTDQSANVLNAVLPNKLAADSGAKKTLISVVTRTDPGEFDGANVGGSMQWRGDLLPGSGGDDSIYKARFDIYIPRGSELQRVTIYDARRRSTVVTLRLRSFGYNPATGELLCAWVNNVDAGGYVTCVDTSGVIKWSFNTIPLPTGLYNIIPVRDHEFIVVQDSLAIRYNNGVAMDTTKYAMQPFQRFRRLLGDRFMRMYRSADTAHYTLELYDMTNHLIGSQQIFRPNAQSTYFVAENAEDGGLGVVMAGPDGVYATVVDKDLVERMPLTQVSHGNDSAFSTSAAFFGDTLFVAWQDNRDTVPRIYCRAFKTGTFVFAVDRSVDAAALAIAGVTPNPAGNVAMVELDVPRTAALALDVYDATGRTVAHRNLDAVAAGHRSLPVDVSTLPSGSYRIVARQDGRVASTALLVVR